MRFILLLFSLLLTSCATGENFRAIKEGMTKDEVTRALGNHDQLKRKEGGWTGYIYRDRLISGWSWDKTDYYVVFDPYGKVFEYGHGEIDTSTSERMADWGRRQQLINSMNKKTTVDCTTYDLGHRIDTSCTSH